MKTDWMVLGFASMLVSFALTFVVLVAGLVMRVPL